MCSVVRGNPLGSPLKCPPWPLGSTPPLGMGLCGLGLLGDNLGKILCWSGGATLWKPSHPQKPHLAPGPQVPRSAERPTLLPLPRYSLTVWTGKDDIYPTEDLLYIRDYFNKTQVFYDVLEPQNYEFKQAIGIRVTL